MNFLDCKEQNMVMLQSSHDKVIYIAHYYISIKK